MDTALLEELSELLRIPSVSADSAHFADVVAAGEWVCSFLRRAGGECRLVDWHGQPIAVGELRASENAESAPTVLCYGHFDVQPPAPLEEWHTPPFEPTVRDGWLYARGVADDKGQLWMLLQAAAGLAAEGRLPVNVRFACDGEEETGGHSIVEFLEADERGADACVIFDSSMLARGVPCFNLSARGMAYFHVKLRTGARDLHSGMFGGAALNALHALTQTLRAVLPGPDGLLPEPLRVGITPPTEAELAAWRSAPDRSGGARRPGGAPGRRNGGRGVLPAHVGGSRPWTCTGSRAARRYSRRRCYPSSPRRTSRSGSRRARTSTRSSAAMERLLRDALPAGAELEIERWSFSPPGLVAPDERAVQLGLDAFERVLGVRPLLVRSGGSLPIVPALAEKGIPTVITGLRPPGREHPLAERAAPARVSAARRRRGARALSRLRRAVALSERARGRRPATRGRTRASPR